jgi:hypothetical protein
MNVRNFVLATLAYVLVSFVLGYTWHLVIFKEAYFGLGAYTREPPIIAFGLASMLVQGLILAWVYGLVPRGERPYAAALRYALVMGLFLWSVAVLAFAAKTRVASLSTFFTLSSLFTLIQFAAYGLLLGWIHARR